MAFPHPSRSFDIDTYRDLKTFKSVPSEYNGKEELLYVKSEKQLYRLKRTTTDGKVFYCTAKNCSAHILLHKGKCLKHCLSSAHNHPDIDPRKIQKMEILHELRNEVKSSSFGWKPKNKWTNLFARFSSR